MQVNLWVKSGQKRTTGKISLVIAQAITSKSYLAGIQSFVDLFGGRPGQGPRIVASLANNLYL